MYVKCNADTFTGNKIPANAKKVYNMITTEVSIIVHMQINRVCLEIKDCL